MNTETSDQTLDFKTLTAIITANPDGIAMFTSMNNIMTELSTLGLEGRRNLFCQIFAKDLLVLDDLGSEVETYYTNQTFIQIVTTCLSKSIPVIVTTPYPEDALLKASGNEKRIMALTRLLNRNINFTVPMPVARRNRNLQQKQKAEALVKGAASQQPLPAFESPADRPETAVQDVPCQPVPAPAGTQHKKTAGN